MRKRKKVLFVLFEKQEDSVATQAIKCEEFIKQKMNKFETYYFVYHKKISGYGDPKLYKELLPDIYDMAFDHEINYIVFLDTWMFNIGHDYFAFWDLMYWLNDTDVKKVYIVNEDRETLVSDFEDYGD